MGASQFVRCHAYTTKSGAPILNEADRVPGFIAHVPEPQTPKWHLGSRQQIELAITKYMSEPAPLRNKDGAVVGRKRRVDHRCLVAGVASWPDPMELCLSSTYPKERHDTLKKWLLLTLAWLKKQYGDKLIAACTHSDESHPHVHFFVVGDAQRIHPGMRNELVNDRRLVVPDERFVAHKAGLKQWLDDFFADVAQPCGLHRSTGARQIWRIRDRATRVRLDNIDKMLAAHADPDTQKERDELWDSVPKIPYPRMRY